MNLSPRADRTIPASRRARAGRGAAAWMLLLATACDSSTKPIPVSSVSIEPAASSVIVGSTQQLEATTRDANGALLVGRRITWSSLSASVATVSSAGLVTTLSPGEATIQASSEGVTGTAMVTVRPMPVSVVSVSPPTATTFVGTTQTFTAVSRDAMGAILTDRGVTWSSSNPSVASVSAAGEVTALATGTAFIEATVEGVIGRSALTVLPVPVSSVTIALPSNVMSIGAQQQATAAALDQNGTTLSGRPMAWSTSDPAVAAISATGFITALTPGIVLITAASEGQSASATLTVQATAASIDAITPATLTPGSPATIVVNGFDASTSSTAITIGDAPASIISANRTQVTVLVPCVSSGLVPVRITNVAIAPTVREHPLAVTPLSVPRGEAIVLTSSAASACNEIAPTGEPARFLLTVFSIASSQNILSSFELLGTTPSSARAAAPVTTNRSAIVPTMVPTIVPAAVRPPAASLRTQRPMVDEMITRHEAQHLVMMERNRQEYQRLMARARSLPRALSMTTPRPRAADVAPGDMRNVFYTFTGGCNDVSRVIRAKAIRIGTKSIIWEDSTNTLQSLDNAQLAGYYDRIGQIYDQEQHASIARSFADPLLRDAVTDDDGKVHMVFTQRLNATGAAAFVTSCDQFPTTVSPGSNFGQYFYGFVPTVATLNVNSSASPDGWFYFMARTVVHEVKHIASLSVRVANNAPSYEETWLEEGTARHAEEMWVRESLHRVPWKGNTGFGTASTNGIYCDFHPSDVTCNAADPLRRPGFGMRRQFNEIRDKLLEPWNWSPFGDGTNQGGAVFYNTTWSLVRYAADRYASADTAFLRALTNTTSTGVANLTAAAGVSFDQLIGGWGLALYADDYPGLSSPSPDLQFPTWNLRAIYAGLNAAPEWTARWNTPFPIQPTALPIGAFFTQRSGVRGGAHAYYEIVGTLGTPQLLHLRTSATTPLGPSLRLAITRLQ